MRREIAVLEKKGETKKTQSRKGKNNHDVNERERKKKRTMQRGNWKATGGIEENFLVLLLFRLHLDVGVLPVRRPHLDVRILLGLGVFLA